jgi:uncharacterized Tic20 family protein
MGQMPVSDEERTWAMLAHLLTLVGYVVWIGAYLVPLVIYLVYKDKSSLSPSMHCNRCSSNWRCWLWRRCCLCCR